MVEKWLKRETFNARQRVALIIALLEWLNMLLWSFHLSQSQQNLRHLLVAIGGRLLWLLLSFYSPSYSKQTADKRNEMSGRLTFLLPTLRRRLR